MFGEDAHKDKNSDISPKSRRDKTVHSLQT